MISLGGNVCIRNGFELDYCWRECIESLLPVCDTVTVCDGESTDGTQDYLRAWEVDEPKLKVCVFKWRNPKGDNDFWVDWLNYCREHIKEDLQIQLDADEVLSELSYPTIRKIRKEWEPGASIAYWCNRYNFWRDAKHLIPPGHCCSHRVCRIGPQKVWMPSDGPHPRGVELISLAQEPKRPVDIMHYGFLRKRDAFFLKARKLQEYFFNSYDQRLADVEKIDDNWMLRVKDIGWINDLVPFTGQHPERMKPWLKERGYELPK